MQQVVQEAGTSIGNCYFYFPNKEFLLHAIVEETTLDIWAKVDEIASAFPPGAVQLAVSYYVLIKALLEQVDLTHIIFMGTAHVKLRNSFLEYYNASFKRYLKGHPELLTSFDLELVSTAWVGATVAMLERVLEGELDHDIETTAQFLIQWNLQAMGLPKVTVEEAIEALKELK